VDLFGRALHVEFVAAALAAGKRDSGNQQGKRKERAAASGHGWHGGGSPGTGRPERPEVYRNGLAGRTSLHWPTSIVRIAPNDEPVPEISAIVPPEYSG
jgi:hypothetical protein